MGKKTSILSANREDVWHPTAAFMTILKQAYSAYSLQEKISLLDYLEELRQKDQNGKEGIDILMEKLERHHERREYSYDSNGLFGFINTKVKKYGKNPENFIHYIIGDEAWMKLTEKIKNRSMAQSRAINEVIKEKIVSEERSSQKGNGRGMYK